MKVKSKDTNRVLSEVEQAVCLEEAERRGLPKGWSVYWDNKKVSDIFFFGPTIRPCSGRFASLIVFLFCFCCNRDVESG